MNNVNEALPGHNSLADILRKSTQKIRELAEATADKGPLYHWAMDVAGDMESLPPHMVWELKAKINNMISDAFKELDSSF